MTVIIGINAYHADSSAAVIVDGKLVAAAEEERFRRIKHWAGFPSEAIRYCLSEAGCRLSDVDIVALNQDASANRFRKIKFLLSNRPPVKLVLERIRTRRKRLNIAEELEQAFPGQRFMGRSVPVEHHLAHLSSAYHVSPFDTAATVSVDGFGDFSSGAWGLARDGEIAVDGRVFFPHSLGIFYQALTQFLGFPHYGDEYKVMGLAPYGKPAFIEEMRQLVDLIDNGEYRLNLEHFRHHEEDVTFEWENGVPVFSELYGPELTELLGPARKPSEPLTQRHMDIGHSVQAMYEEAFFHLLVSLHEKYKITDLALAGGCAMNSVANGKIYRRSPFQRVYIQSAAGDAGGAIGAALVAWHRDVAQSGSRHRMEHAYWGPAFDNPAVQAAIDERRAELEAARCEVRFVAEESELCERTAAAIADGLVVGWFQGRMEWGPRALGNRSIVCDPRRTDMKDILNLKIKRRESFRPFAPSILREQVPDWFEEDDDVPFMMKVFQIREDKRPTIPAVTHVDGSGRLQTVAKETNPRYYNLIRAFAAKTGVPIVLNTSFNENEPVVCRPEEALDCFLRTNMDVLVLSDFFILRHQED